MRPLILPQFFPQANLGNLPKEVDEIVRGIIDIPNLLRFASKPSWVYIQKLSASREFVDYRSK